jgi:hypothetical protein
VGSDCEFQEIPAIGLFVLSLNEPESLEREEKWGDDMILYPWFSRLASSAYSCRQPLLSNDFAIIASDLIGLPDNPLDIESLYISELHDILNESCRLRIENIPANNDARLAILFSGKYIHELTILRRA